MQFKSLVAVAALAMTVRADSATPAGNGALDLSHKGLVAVNKRAGQLVHGDQGAKHGAVGFRSAMDLAQISKPNPPQPNSSKREIADRAPPAAAEDDEPWVVEWRPGQSLLEEVRQSPTAKPAAPASSPSTPPQQQGKPQGHEQATGKAAASVPPAVSAAASVTPTPAVPVPAASSPAAGEPAPIPAASSHSSSSVATPAGVPAPIHSTLALPTVPTIPAAGKPTSAGSATTPAPAAGNTGAAPAGPKGALTFNIVNKMGGSITISYQLGTYSPATGGATTVASQLLNVGSKTTGTFATSTQVVAPVGWAGRMTIGKAGGPLDYRGTKIEGNNGFDGADPNADPDPDVDVSYVDGYSVPASCSCGSEVLTGCNKELFDLGNKCSNLVGDGEHKICVNDPRDIHGPASPFFAPCAKAAYTYDYDDVANWQGKCAGGVVNCCIGTDCPAPTRQPAGKTKREILALLSARKRAAAAKAA